MVTPKPNPQHGEHAQKREWHFITCWDCRSLLDRAQNSDSYRYYAREGMTQGELVEAYCHFAEKMSES